MVQWRGLPPGARSRGVEVGNAARGGLKPQCRTPGGGERARRRCVCGGGVKLRAPEEGQRFS